MSAWGITVEQWASLAAMALCAAAAHAWGGRERRRMERAHRDLERDIKRWADR